VSAPSSLSALFSRTALPIVEHGVNLPDFFFRAFSEMFLSAGAIFFSFILGFFSCIEERVLPAGSSRLSYPRNSFFFSAKRFLCLGDASAALPEVEESVTKQFS